MAMQSTMERHQSPGKWGALWPALLCEYCFCRGGCGNAQISEEAQGTSLSTEPRTGSATNYTCSHNKDQGHTSHLDPLYTKKFFELSHLLIHTISTG